MSKKCDLTGIGPTYGYSVSHAHKHSHRRWEPNLKKKRIFLPEENRWITVRLSAAALKTLTRKGMSSVQKMKARMKARNARAS